MIFKVYVQESKNQIPVRERTKALYLEADSKIEVYQKFKETPYLIEHIQELEGNYLEYEKQSNNFKLMEI
ncbi:RNA polymerase epsilon subunit [Caldifermentibacillus hisashii]|uniref:DNA-dependent RNA polymerase subunit epsilon n=1 Tax=Caldifermentibacillus hisashii TaxID=996558 RepID=UPI002E1DC70F|nr:RNA polymerase epsilon subunit [Caldifermentibacillus hisashii]